MKGRWPDLRIISDMRLLNRFFPIFLICLSSSSFAMGDFRPGKVTVDTQRQIARGNVDVAEMFNVPNARFIISDRIASEKQIVFGEDCELVFKDGGSLQADLVFNRTLLSGEVNLKGSSISGTVSNDSFNAGWLCPMDGKSDDAAAINQMIAVCDTILFPKGVYTLLSTYAPPHEMKGRSSIKCHVGINRSHVFLRGEDGAQWYVPDVVGAVCIFTPPGEIDNSVRDITIDNLEFRVQNDGEHFHEWTHTVHCIGVDGLVIRNCFFNDFWGDAITLGHYGDTPETGERARNQNVTITGNRIQGGDHHNNRNGISVINGKNVLIEGNTILNTTKSDMPGAIDVEPNNTAYTIDNIIIRKNKISGCRGTAGGICVHANKKGGPAHNITIEGNEIGNCTSGLSFVIAADNTTSNFTVRNNVVDEDTRPFQFIGSGKSSNWTISDNVLKKGSAFKLGGSIKVSGFVQKNNQFGNKK